MSEQSVIIKMYPREKHLGNGIWEMAFGKRHLGNGIWETIEDHVTPPFMNISPRGGRVSFHFLS